MDTTLIWTIVLVIAIVVEAITIDLVSIWFALGALLALLCSVIGLSHTLQVVIFTVVSILSMFIVRPLAKQYLRGNTVKTNFDRVIGQHCLITKTITADKLGEAKVMEQLWSATSLDNETIDIGDYAEIVSIEGAHLVVKKI